MGNKKISFIGIGSGKSGSSWLWKQIISHPEISDKNAKEINYFSSLFNKKSLSWYQGLFAKDNLIHGEFSVTYIDDKDSAERIFNYNKDVKLICILRNPVERIISDYYHSIRKGDTSASVSLSDFIGNEKNLTYGKYKNKLEEYFNYFEKNQILILEMEEILKNKKNIRNVYKFLSLHNINYFPTDINTIVNKGFIPKVVLIENFITYISKSLTKYGAIKLLEILKTFKIHNLIRKYNSKKIKSDNHYKERVFLRNYFKTDIDYFVNEYEFKNWK